MAADAAAKSSRKVFKSSVCLIPPPVHWPRIQAIRKDHDKVYRRWMPHMNFLYPFLEDKGDAFQQAAEHLAGRLAAVEPFEVSLPHFEAFLRKKGSTVWLAPHSDPPQALQDLHAALLDAFPQCDDTAKAGQSGFTPHLSVGQWPKRAAKAAVTTMSTEWGAHHEPCPAWTVDAVYLISRGSFTDPFHVRYRVPLGGGAPEPIAEGSGDDWVTDGAIVLPDGTLTSEAPSSAATG